MAPDQTAFKLRRWYRILLVLVVVLAFGWLVWIADRLASVDVPKTVVLYCFSAMDEVMTEEILPAFKQDWVDRTGESVEFIVTFAGSGTITAQIIDRFPAEVAILSSEFDVRRLAAKGVFMPRGTLPHGGVVSRSPIVLFVRPGNPKEIRGFQDLGRDGMRVLHADPLTSGAGEWSLAASYSSSLQAGASRAEAERHLQDLWKNVERTAPSARKLLQQFQEGSADAAITYLADAVRMVDAGAPWAEVVCPPSSVLSEHVVVKIAKNVKAEQQELVDAFVSFLWSEEAQQKFVEYGFRSVLPELNRDDFPCQVPVLRTLEDLGGAQEISADVIDRIWLGQVRPQTQAR
jgi:sulfate transport system substrate-binding protein